MKKLNTKTVTFWIIVLLFLSIGQTVPTISASSNSDKSLSILSNVFCLDLSKYNVTLNGIDDHFNTNFGSNVNQQSVTYTLVSGDNKVSADFQFVSDSFWYCNIYIIKGNLIYTQTPPLDVLNQSKSVIQRYSVYAAQYSKSYTYISSMASILNTVSELKSTSVTAGNVKLNISITPTRISNVPMQTLKWIYTENGIDVIKKAVSLEYTNGVLTSIRDTWNLYSTGTLETISQEEASNIAWSAAQNATLEFISSNNATYKVKPDLSNVTSKVAFSMQQRGNNTVLYPYWDFQYWFINKPYEQVRGIEVGLWGDTKQVDFCKPIVVLGGSETSDTPNSDTPTSQASPNDGLPINAILMVSGAGLIVALAVAGIVVQKRRNKQQPNWKTS